MTTTIKEQMVSEAKQVVDTEGVTVEDIRAMPIEERPPFTIAKAIEWARRPENAERIEQTAQRIATKAEHAVARADEHVTHYKNVMVDILTDEDVKEDFVNSFLESVFGDD